MDQTKLCGTQSLHFQRPAYILSAASVAGKKEAEGPLGKKFDMVDEQDNLFGAKTWEEAESNMQKEACILAIGKAGLKPEKIRYLFGGDLLRQGIATSMGVEALQIPMFGLYGACSTSGEALALAAMSVSAGYGDSMLAVTSSHFGKGVPFSVGLCQPETFICTLDSDRERGFCSGNGSGKCEDQRDHSGKDRGLRTERFAEYGSMHGSGGC